MTWSKLYARLLNILAPVTITAIDDTGTVMRAQLAVGGTPQTLEGVPVLQQYGFASVPPVGSDGAAVFIGGDRSNGVVVGTNGQATRPVGKKPGESVAYGPNGSMVYFTTTGIMVNGGGQPITVTNATAVTITSDSIKFNGDLLVVGNITAQGNMAATGNISATGDVFGANIT